MDQKALRLLEYDKIIAMLVDRAATKLGQEQAGALQPFSATDEVEAALAETRSEERRVGEEC